MALLFLVLAACSREAVVVKRGDVPPAFETTRLDGTPVHFPTDLAGHPVVIRFWADWCRYCEGEMKDIEAILRQHPQRDVTVLAVNVGQDQATATAFIAKLGVTYPALLDEDADIARRYGVAGLPTTFFVDRQGRIAAKQVGEMTAAAFERQIAELAP